MKKLLLKTFAVMLIISMSIAYFMPISNAAWIPFKDDDGNISQDFKQTEILEQGDYKILKKHGAFNPTSLDAYLLLIVYTEAELAKQYKEIDYLYNITRTRTDNIVDGTDIPEKDYMIPVTGMSNDEEDGFIDGLVAVEDAQYYLQLISTRLKYKDFYNEHKEELIKYKENAPQEEIEDLDYEIEKIEKSIKNKRTYEDYQKMLKESLVNVLKVNPSDIKQNIKIQISQHVLDSLGEKYNKDLSKYKVFKNHTTNELIINNEEDQRRTINELLEFGYYLLDITEEDINGLSTLEKWICLYKGEQSILGKMMKIPNIEITEEVTVNGKTTNYLLTLCKEYTNAEETEAEISWYWVPDWLIDEEFHTKLEYTQNIDGKDRKGTDFDKDGTFLAKYNDDNNDKTDPDVRALVKSQTLEKIVKANGTDVKKDFTRTTDGWYYSDKDDLTIIGKDYKFADYDNTTYNGIVPTEKVKATGELGIETEETVSIKWTFRIKKIDKVENKDGSTTVTIEYNLPVDPTSIPEGWSPIYDKDGKTVHKITKTIAKGEDYDKDVTVKQNGTGIEKTTHITVKAKKEETKKEEPKKDDSTAKKVIPQTGGKMILAFAVLASIVVLIITYRKNKKIK